MLITNSPLQPFRGTSTASTIVTIFSTFAILATILAVGLLALGDLLTDLSHGENTLHLFSEGVVFAVLFGITLTFGRKLLTALLRAKEFERHRGGITTGIMAVVLVCALTVDDLPDMTESASAAGRYLTTFVFDGNFNEVVPRRFYRSAQLSPSELKQVIDEHGIKTVINLRLGDDEEQRREAELVRSAGVRYEHIPFRSSRVPPRDQVETLLNAFDRAETPVLVHCTSGTHRSGFASAIWLLDYEHVSRREAREQFSNRFGYFEFERKLKAYLRGHPGLDTVIDRYITEADEFTSFREWVAASL